jgi:hypothetical protein
MEGQHRYFYLVSVLGAVGGLLRGYDTGVIAGALASLAWTFHRAAQSLGIGIAPGIASNQQPRTVCIALLAGLLERRV